MEAENHGHGRGFLAVGHNKGGTKKWFLVASVEGLPEERILIPEKHGKFDFPPCLFRYLQMSRAVRTEDHNNLFESYLRQEMKRGGSELSSSNIEGRFFFLLRGPPPSPAFATNKMHMEFLSDSYRNFKTLIETPTGVCKQT